MSRINRQQAFSGTKPVSGALALPVEALVLVLVLGPVLVVLVVVVVVAVAVSVVVVVVVGMVATFVEKEFAFWVVCCSWR